MSRWILAAALLAVAVEVSAVNPAELLDPQDAFRISGQKPDERELILEVVG